MENGLPERMIFKSEREIFMAAITFWFGVFFAGLFCRHQTIGNGLWNPSMEPRNARVRVPGRASAMGECLGLRISVSMAVCGVSMSNLGSVKISWKRGLVFMDMVDVYFVKR